MTATRMARSRFFVGLGILLLMVGFVAIFHSSQEQLDELRKATLRCEQQQLVLVAQMETHSVQQDQNINAEKQLNRRLQNEMQQKLKSEKELKDKAIRDWTLRFTSQQQHCKILQSEHEDLKEECANTRRKNLEDVSGYQVKVKALKGQLALLERRKDAEIDEWKAKYYQIQSVKTDLERILDAKIASKVEPAGADLLKYKNKQLERDLDEMKNHCAFRPGSGGAQLSSSTRSAAAGVQEKPNVEKSFDAQVLIIPKPLQEINAGDNNVLKEPPAQDQSGGKVSSSTATLDKADLKSKAVVERAPPIALVPTISTTKKSAIGRTVSKAKKLPEGVVPLPESMNEFMKNEAEEKEKEDSKNKPPNRYSNVQESPFPVGDMKLGDHVDANALQNGNEIDNGAHEVNDNNDFNIIEDRNHHDHVLLDDDKVNVINNNAAEVEANMDRVKGNDDDIDLNIINHNLNLMSLQKKQKAKVSNDKFNEEVAGDQGFDEHLEEQPEEEDDDEYSNNLAARQEGQAVRN